MIPIYSVFDRIAIREIYTSGHSRIPVYDGSRDNILGVLLVKVMLLIEKFFDNNSLTLFFIV
jgi:metal transporter CNNM